MLLFTFEKGPVLEGLTVPLIWKWPNRGHNHSLGLVTIGYVTLKRRQTACFLAKINTVAAVASLFSIYFQVLKSSVLLPHVVFVHRDVVAVDHYKCGLLGGNLPAWERQRLNAVYGAPHLCFNETGCVFLHVHIFYDCHGTGASPLRCSWAKKKASEMQVCVCVYMQKKCEKSW